ncbi:MAG: pyruvate kinase, partial [Actinobacteria bacterium]
MRYTKIIATVGPSSSSEEVLTEMIRAGVDVFRFNLSHSNQSAHRKTLKS